MPIRSFIRLLIIMIHLFFLSVSAPTYSMDDHPPATSALIVFDDSEQWQWIGYLHSVFLANLLGHFHQDYKIISINQYTKGLLSQFDTLFYFGVVYDRPLPPYFINDVLNTEKEIVWFNYNLWQLNQNDSYFEKHFGFQFNTIDTTGYNHILYKNTKLKKNIKDAALGKVTISDTTRATVLATALIDSEKNIPYIIHSQNLWYIADIPFSFLDENDRYLVFADILYDILHISAVPQKRALLRLEDIDPTYDIKLLKSMADYLYEQKIPFAISVIPYYQDPLNFYLPDLYNFVKITDEPLFIETLNYMISKGGSLVLHGYTHQYSNIPNPYLGISGADYEFARVAIDPNTMNILSVEDVVEDSKEWVADRIMKAEALIEDAGLKTKFWETPHYTASFLDNQFFAEHFYATVGRIEYYDPEKNNRHHANQFFPYVIYKDTYGQKVIPENLGCLAPVAWYNYPKREIQDILITAKNNLVIRDAWASLYYHPFLGMDYLKQLTSGIKALGYEFVSIEDI